MQWRIYYGDGFTFDATQGAPSDAPCVDVQAIVQPDADVGRTITTRFDWYWWREDDQLWYGGDLTGYLDQAMRCGARHPKQGRSLTSPEYQRVLTRAMADPDFPPKSAFHPGENRVGEVGR